jgi:hypothetical protein
MVPYLHFTAALAVAVLAASPGTACAEDALRTTADIERCIAANLPSHALAETLLLRSFDREGEVAETRATLTWKRPGDGTSRFLLRVVEPDSRRGTALLAIYGEDGSPPDAALYLYLPAARRARRIGGNSLATGMFGTDLAYEDFEHLRRLTPDADLRRLDDAQVGSRAAVVLEARPQAAAESAYERIVALIDRERCIALRAELFERGGRLRKVVELPAERATREAFGWVPRLVSVEDRVDGTRTEIVVEAVDDGADITDGQLTVAGLEAPG